MEEVARQRQITEWRNASEVERKGKTAVSCSNENPIYIHAACLNRDARPQTISHHQSQLSAKIPCCYRSQLVIQNKASKLCHYKDKLIALP